MTANQSHLEPNKEAMLLQLTHLFGETHADGVIELAWTDPQNNHALSKARLFDITDFGEIPDFAAARNAEGSNIYIGAALRKKGLPDHKRTSDDAFISLTAAYVDLDEPGVASKAREIYGAVGPTLVVITGQHPHFRAQLWWRLDEPEADPDKSRSLNKHLAVALSGDETVVNPSRVMRLGGSIAWPVKPGRVAEVTEVQLLGRPDVPAEALLNIVKHVLPQLPQTSATLPENTQTPVTHHSTLNLPDLNGLSVDGCIANIRAGREWHRNMVKLTAHWVNAGMSDQEILLAAESLTLAGYTREETRIEVLKMLQGAREKWSIQNPSLLLEQPKLSPIPSLVLKDWNGHKYAGEAPEQRWLVENQIPLGVPILLAAMGGVGKSYMALDLALHVSLPTTSMSFPYRVFGGQLKEHGTAVILAAEDSYETIHRRFNKIDEADKRVLAGDRLIVVPMPSVGGPRPLIDVENGVPQKTEFFYDFKAQLLELPDLKLVVIDPLQAFNMADVTSDPAAAQFMWSALAEICAETGATIIVTHHMRKEGMHNITSVAGAREAIRGSTALVDGARGAYALWQADKDFARICCQFLGRDFEENAIIQGAIVKTNDDVLQAIHTYARAESGLLVQDLNLSNLDPDEIGYPDFEKEIEILKEIENRWNLGEPVSQAPNTGPRYIVKFLKKHFGLSKSVAQTLQGKWVDDGIITSEMVNSSSKLKGYRLIKLPEQKTEGAEAWYTNH